MTAFSSNAWNRLTGPVHPSAGHPDPMWLTLELSRHMRTLLVSETGTISRSSFAISRELRAQAGDNRVRFDVMLEPSSLHYSIR